MSSLPYYPMYASDFNVSTTEWTNEEVGIYIRLLNYAWVKGSCPAQCVRMASIVGMDPVRFEQLWSEKLGTKWTPYEGDADYAGASPRLVNAYQERIRLEVTERGARRKSAAKHAANARWGKSDAVDAAGIPDALQTHCGTGVVGQCERNASQSQSQIVKDERSPLYVEHSEKEEKDPEIKPPKGAAEPYKYSARGWIWGSEADLELARKIHACCILAFPKLFRDDSDKAYLTGWGAAWADAIRLMRVRDGHAHEEIWELFWWAHNDVDDGPGKWPGWRSNMQSPKSLRAKWDTLITRREEALRYEKNDRRDTAAEKLDRQLGELGVSGTKPVIELREGADGFTVERNDGDI